MAAGKAAAAVADTVISFVNVYPGSDIYELEGHSALRITMPQGDYAVNFGVFDFNKPHFVYRFVKGETDYMAAAYPWQFFEEQYRSEGRRVVEHRLNFTSGQKARLIELLNDHLQPENTTYRYNYVKDNCATRPLRLVELAAGDTILFDEAAAGVRQDESFRDIMRRYHANYPWYQFGIDLALGPGIDYTVDIREHTFAPVELEALLPTATIGGKPLIADTLTIIDLQPTAKVGPPTPWLLSPLAVSLLLLAIIIWVTIRDLRRRRVTRWIDAAYFALLGLAGLLIAFLVLISTHEATSPNWLIFWLNPLCLIPTIFIWIKSCKRVVMWYQIINFAAILTLVCAWAWLPQSANAAFLPLAAADALLAARYIYI